MDFINPLFDKTEIINPKKTPNKKQVENTKIRKTRSDKTHSIKFPVNSITQIKLRSLAKQAGRLYKEQGREPLSQTKFNTKLLRFGLQHPHLLSWQHDYIDTKVYMHTNILEIEYTEIGGPHGLAIRKNLSDRKVVYQIMNSVLKWLEGGGSLEEIL